jgi:hydroxypyruvate reductase/glycerate 2-kinase
VTNRIIGSNRIALDAAVRKAEEFGYRVWDLGSALQGETATVAALQAKTAACIKKLESPILSPIMPPACVLSGGETTVTLGVSQGKGGRNQEFVLAAIQSLGVPGLDGLTILSGGTDGEDGPTDAAGAVADQRTLAEAAANHLDPDDALRRHDAYPFFDKLGGLIRTGLTGTNVMDVRVILVR